MYTLEKVKKQIVKDINKALGDRIVQASDLVIPPQPDYGDLSIVCFNIGNKLSKSAIEAAGWLVGEIRIEGILAGVKAIGPYLNFTLNKQELAKSTLKEIKKTKDNYGKNKIGKEKRVIIEYSNVNTHKAYHVGHLRNICYGDAVNRILDMNGYFTIPVSYINDFGIHVAKTIWGFIEIYKKKSPKDNKGRFLGKVYAKAVAELEKDSLANEKVAFLMRKIESRKGEEYKLWKETRKWSIAQFDEIYKELKVKFKEIFYESEYIKEGMEIVEKLYKKRVLIKSEGAIIADLEEHDLGVLLFLRSDGTAMYPVADMALAQAKQKKYKPDISVYITDIRQSLHFKKLFKILEISGYKIKLQHLEYEFVKLPEGMISSRSGAIIAYEDLREQVFKRAYKETKERHKNWGEDKIKNVADKITNGALKFEMIKVSAKAIITFDINQALRFDGFTAAYLQYTYARINSIIKKNDTDQRSISNKQVANNANIKYNKLNEAKEYELLVKLARFPEAVASAGEKHDPSEIAKYLFELAQNFNDYYHQVPILKSEKEVRKARLDLILAINQVIKNGLNIIGIDIIEEM